ncbi:13678_t:CDS:2 [Funneliformis mosseae]|uniref:13678_t:CDS:1 n=1 Tax=Funneliformis mosseae TaxID=27381 RepID=A0A9N8WJ81_FUNMO|nr:13678_t:CDS:2 [Funneliformis mosseae]
MPCRSSIEHFSDSLFNLKSISVVDILAYYQKEFLNDNFKEIYDALAKDLEEVLMQCYLYVVNLETVGHEFVVLRASWKKQTLKQVRRDQKQSSLNTKKNVATVVDVETSKWVEEMTNNDEVLMYNMRRNAEDEPETARPENIKR